MVYYDVIPLLALLSSCLNLLCNIIGKLYRLGDYDKKMFFGKKGKDKSVFESAPLEEKENDKNDKSILDDISLEEKV